MATLARFLKNIRMALGFILSPWWEISPPKKEKEKKTNWIQQVARK
jgi:hypothetical protein